MSDKVDGVNIENVPSGDSFVTITKWEYDIHPTIDKKKAEDKFAELGDQDWEFCGHTPIGYIFKRPFLG